MKLNLLSNYIKKTQLDSCKQNELSDGFIE